QFELGAFFETHFKLDAAVNRRRVEREDARLLARAERELHAAQLHVVTARKPDFLEPLAWADGERHRLGELLPDGLQRVEVGVAPFLLPVRGERRRHATASA